MAATRGDAYHSHRMSYIDYMNQFNELYAEGVLSTTEGMLYVRLLALFNDRRWKQPQLVADPFLCVWAGISSPNTLKKARQVLQDQGLIGFVGSHKGRGNMGEYRLLQLVPGSSEQSPEKPSLKASKNDSFNDSFSDGFPADDEPKPSEKPSAKVSGIDTNIKREDKEDNNPILSPSASALASADVSADRSSPELNTQAAPAPPPPVAPPPSPSKAKGKRQPRPVPPDFEGWWKAYGKSADKFKCEQKWAELSQDERDECLMVVEAYVQSTPVVQYRKNPLTYLNGRCWRDEVQPVPQPAPAASHGRTAGQPAQPASQVSQRMSAVEEARALRRQRNNGNE